MLRKISTMHTELDQFLRQEAKWALARKVNFLFIRSKPSLDSGFLTDTYNTQWVKCAHRQSKLMLCHLYCILKPPLNLTIFVFQVRIFLQNHTLITWHRICERWPAPYHWQTSRRKPKLSSPNPNSRYNKKKISNKGRENFKET